MTYLIKKGFTQEVHVREIEEAITYVRGPDKRTLDNWKRALLKLGFLRLKSFENKLVYRMDLSRTPELLSNEEISQALEDMKQKKLG